MFRNANVSVCNVSFQNMVVHVGNHHFCSGLYFNQQWRGCFPFLVKCPVRSVTLLWCWHEFINRWSRDVCSLQQGRRLRGRFYSQQSDPDVYGLKGRLQDIKLNLIFTFCFVQKDCQHYACKTERTHLPTTQCCLIWSLISNVHCAACREKFVVFRFTSIQLKSMPLFPQTVK